MFSSYCYECIRYSLSLCRHIPSLSRFSLSPHVRRFCDSFQRYISLFRISDGIMSRIILTEHILQWLSGFLINLTQHVVHCDLPRPRCKAQLQAKILSSSWNNSVESMITLYCSPLLTHELRCHETQTNLNLTPLRLVAVLCLSVNSRLKSPVSWLKPQWLQVTLIKPQSVCWSPSPPRWSAFPPNCCLHLRYSWLLSYVLTIFCVINSVLYDCQPYERLFSCFPILLSHFVDGECNYDSNHWGSNQVK